MRKIFFVTINLTCLLFTFCWLDNNDKKNIEEPISYNLREELTTNVSLENVIEEEVETYDELEQDDEGLIAEEPILEKNLQPIDRNYDIMIRTNLTREDLVRSLGGIRGGMKPYIDAIIEAEKIYGINSLYLISALGYESGWGKYESGYNNISGWVINGHFYNFNSKYECIMTTAAGLANDFIPDTGSDIVNVANRYCQDYGYLDTLLQIMSELQNNL